MVGESESENWTTARIPPQVGRLAVVTAGATGLGYATALALAKAGADVVVAANDEFQGFRAVSQIRPVAPAALVRFEKLDTGNLASVAAFAARLQDVDRPVDLLINHSTDSMHLSRQTTEDGFEHQLGANYLAHFALTARLLPLLRRGRKPRIVQVCSLCQRPGSIDFDNLHLERDYDPWKAHCQAMLASLLFAQELQRRSDLFQWGLVSVAAHPGNVRLRLIADGVGPKGLVRRLRGSLAVLLSNPPSGGALPALFAATASSVQRGGFYGPSGLLVDYASPGKNSPGNEDAHRLWEVSEQLTQAKWPAE